jgi:hypothetical protein
MVDSPITVQSGFICDQSRREDNGKLLFIGVYGPDLQLTDLPVSFICCLVIQPSTIASGQFQLEVRVRSDDQPRFTGHILINAKGNERFIPLNGIPLEINEFGELTFEIRQDEGAWIPVCTAQVIPRSAS